MKQRAIIATIAAVATLVVALFIWPTLYRYDKVNLPGISGVFVRTNRITGNSQALTSYGWHDMRKAQAKPPEN